MSEKELTGQFSVDNRKPGHDAYVKQGGHNAGWRITLDGEEVHQVVAVDTHKGEILVNELDERGKLIVHGGRITQKTLHGVVQVFVDA